MAQAFPTRLLAFIDSVHNAHTYEGLTSLQRQGASGVRTIYRWQKTLGRALVYYPEVAFCRFGLAHVHLFVEEASPVLLHFPFAVENAWVLRRLGERLLYLHCMVPVGDQEAFFALMEELQRYGVCGRFSVVHTQDGWQGMHALAQSFDRAGRVQGPFAEALCWSALGGAQGCGMDALTEEFPLVIPVVFEHYGERVSLQQVWLRMYARLHLGVWKYLPRKQRKWPVNGKTYVKRALAVLSERGLFRQNWVWYTPVLEHTLEVFLVVKQPFAALTEFVRRVEQAAPIVQAYPGETTLLRCVGDTGLLYALVALVPEEMADHVELYVLDRDYTARHAEHARLAYELLFDVEQKAWVFPKEKILQCLGVTHGAT